MQWISTYLVTGAIFVALDAAWLAVMGPRFYRVQLGPMMRDQIAFAPAIAFYVIYVGALVALVVSPALVPHNPTRALFLGLLFGLAAYATYDLTNASTLKGWPSVLTLVDMAWGSLVTGAAAWLAVSALGALRSG